MNKEHYSDAYEKKFEECEIYRKFPQLVPWIGSEYDRFGLLLIAESHYLPASSSIHKDDSVWYSSDINLSGNEILYTNTRNIISSGKNQKWNGTGHSIYRNIEKAIIQSGFSPEDKSNLFRYAAFYNFFLRPALKGKSLDYTSRDADIAVATFNYIVDIIRPKVVMIMSRKPWNILRTHKIVEWDISAKKHSLADGTRIEYVPHPGCAHWNRQHDKYQIHKDGIARTGRQRFVDLLKAESVFQ